jgi:hypothetical protein
MAEHEDVAKSEGVTVKAENIEVETISIKVEKELIENLRKEKTELKVIPATFIVDMVLRQYLTELKHRKKKEP